MVNPRIAFVSYFHVNDLTFCSKNCSCPKKSVWTNDHIEILFASVASLIMPLSDRTTLMLVGCQGSSLALRHMMRRN